MLKSCFHREDRELPLELDPELEEPEEDCLPDTFLEDLLLDDLGVFFFADTPPVTLFFFGAVRRTDLEELPPHPLAHCPADTARRSMPPTMMA